MHNVKKQQPHHLANIFLVKLD